MSGQLHVPATLTLRNSLWYQLDTRLGSQAREPSWKWWQWEKPIYAINQSQINSVRMSECRAGFRTYNCSEEAEILQHSCIEEIDTHQGWCQPLLTGSGMYVCKGWAIKLAPAPRPSMIYTGSGNIWYELAGHLMRNTACLSNVAVYLKYII
jgi:hypothetical protein